MPQAEIEKFMSPGAMEWRERGGGQSQVQGGQVGEEEAAAAVTVAAEEEKPFL